MHDRVQAERVLVSVLHWAVRPSFIHYLAAQPGSKVYMGEGAGLSDETFTFPSTSETDDVYAFAGVVTFQAHGGLLHLELREPQLQARAGGYVLSVSHLGTRLDVAHIAGLREPNAEGIRHAGETLLLAGATHLFGDVYEAGAPLANPYLRD